MFGLFIHEAIELLLSTSSKQNEHFLRTSTISINLSCIHPQVSKWFQNRLKDTGVLLVTRGPSGGWREREVSSNQPEGLTDTNIYLLIFSDDGRTKADRSQLGTLMGRDVCVVKSM